MSDDLEARVLSIIRESYDMNAHEWRDNAIMVAHGALSRCESPIEKLMGAALSFAFGEHFPCLIGPSCPLWPPTGDFLLIEPQREIGGYRADFAITGRSSWASDMLCESHIVVECDGHDFHERTKEQAKRDKERDRFLASEGWTVLRFTGSEIVRDPIKCALSVAEYLGGDFQRQAELQRRAANG